MDDATQLFKGLSDPIRLRCLALILAEDRLCVCELCEALDMVQPKISRHMAMLRKLGIVETERQAHWVFYHLKTDLAAWQRAILETALVAQAGLDPFVGDTRRLAAMADRPNCCN